MDIVTFTNTKVNGAICDEQKYQSHVTSSGVCDTEKLAHEIAENLKDSAAYVGSVFGELAKTIKAHLQLGERVTLDGICRLELVPEGAADTEDAPWDPKRNRLVVNAIAYDAVKYAAKDIVPVNTLKPITIQLLGAQDETTLEQDAVTKGNRLLCQGKNIRLTAANADEGLFVVNAAGEHKLDVVDSTAGTIDATVPESVPAGVYTLEVRGRSGLGKNRMLVTARIANFEIKEG